MVQVKRNIYLLLSILLLVVTVTIFGPLELYFTNFEEFWFTQKDVLIVVCIQMLICAIVLSLIGVILKGKARDLYSGILFAAGIALYLQGNYANMNYGVLNGEEIDWSAYPVYAILDTLGWILIFAIVIGLWLYKREWVHKIQIYVSACVIATQIVTLVILLFTTNVVSGEKSNYYLTNDGIYEVSSEENIIVFVLDGFEDVYFQEMLKEEPEKYNSVFKDFTHFRNASAGGAHTKIGMPAIITGEPYPGEISYEEYIQESFNRDGLYTELKRQNYDVRFYTSSAFIPDKTIELVDNQASTGYEVSSYFQLAGKYGSLTLYKYVPHVLKRFFWLYTGEFDKYKTGSSSEEYKTNDLEFFEGLQEEQLQTVSGENVFRLIHLNGAHPPFILDEYAQPIENGESSIIQQGKGALYIVEKYISQLKQLGIYESATIIVMADHGREKVEHGILLVKESNKKKSFAESDAPVSYYDLHSTLFRVLGINRGPTFFEISEGMRERFFYYNETENGKMRVVECVINGNINDDGVIRETGVVLEPFVDNSLCYQYGTKLTFGANNTALPYIVRGVSSIDMANFSWTDGKECEFEFAFEDMPEKNLLVTMDVMTIYDQVGTQRVTIYANDVKSYTDTLTKGKQIQFVVPNAIVLEDKTLTLRIDLPDAVCPSAVFGEGHDGRTLGLAITGLQIDEISKETNMQDSAGEEISKISFGTEGNAAHYLQEGWYESEVEYNWSSGYAEILMPMSEQSDYDLTLHYKLFGPSGETTCYINNTPLAALDGGETTITLHISKELLNKDGNQTLAFETLNAVSPHSVGENEDIRVLGVCLYSMDIVSLSDSEE